jgi:hypothetical protein
VGCRIIAYLVTVSPEVVLGADVLVRVLGPLRAGVLVLLVSNVLPVGIPSDLGVDAGDDDAGDGDAETLISECPAFFSDAKSRVFRASNLLSMHPPSLSHPQSDPLCLRLQVSRLTRETACARTRQTRPRAGQYEHARG